MRAWTLWLSCAQYMFIEALNKNPFIREGNNSECGLERGTVELLETEGMFQGQRLTLQSM